MYNVSNLYSTQEFLEFISSESVYGIDFNEMKDRFSISKPYEIFDLATRCNWVYVNNDGYCVCTHRGGELLKHNEPETKLRHQLLDVIEVYQPRWAIKIKAGRTEVKRFMPESDQQIFREAGLFDGFSDDVVEWWDRISLKVRGNKSFEMLKVGRRAERLTCDYEKLRTGKEPHWQSIESNFSGFDVLSSVSQHDSQPLMIEVKGTSLGIKEAFFTVTRNEWETAEISENYRFHLWLLSGEERFIDISASELTPNLPVNRGSGKWEQVRIPFKLFTNNVIKWKEYTKDKQ